MERYDANVIPVLFRSADGAFELQTYAFLVLISFAGAFTWIVARARNAGWRERDLQRALRWNWLVALLSGILAGAVWRTLSESPHTEWLRARSISSWFIVSVGLWTLVALAKRRKFPVAEWMHWSVLAFFGVWAAERAAAFVSGQDFGVVSTVKSFALQYPSDSEAFRFQRDKLGLDPGERSLPVVPIQLMEMSLVCLAWWSARKVGRIDWGQTTGRSAGILLCTLAITSLALEPYYAEYALRGGSLGSLSPRQLFAICAMVIGPWLLLRRSKAPIQALNDTRERVEPEDESTSTRTSDGMPRRQRKPSKKRKNKHKRK